ncbi:MULTISPECIES: hypothetical protein [unclassified Phyllobacterium]|uniref:hypothetical protein n=1 Tax=unclassified Phyllobacterium TaxID=2638441 RepID=UPI003012BF92
MPKKKEPTPGLHPLLLNLARALGQADARRDNIADELGEPLPSEKTRDEPPSEQLPKKTKRRGGKEVPLTIKWSFADPKNTPEKD